jgi:hypothetical protein
MSRRILAVALSLLLSGTALPGQTAPAGVVLQSQSARLNTVDAAAGTTVYDGDRLETQSKGLLNIRSGQVQLALSEESTLWMNHENSVLTPVLQRGSVTFRAENGVGVEIKADDVRVRPHAAVLTIGQVTLEQCYVLVTARTQSLEVSAGKESKILEEGKSYRVARVGTCGAAQYHPPLSPGYSRFNLVASVVVGVLTYLAVDEALESPDRP